MIETDPIEYDEEENRADEMRRNVYHVARAAWAEDDRAAAALGALWYLAYNELSDLLNAGRKVH